MIVPAILSGVFMACGIYLALADEGWRRLGGIAFIDNALAQLAISAGADMLASVRIAFALALAAFALFLVQASLLRKDRVEIDSPPNQERPQ